MSNRTQFEQIYLRDIAYLITLQEDLSGCPIKNIYIF